MPLGTAARVAAACCSVAAALLASTLRRAKTTRGQLRDPPAAAPSASLSPPTMLDPGGEDAGDPRVAAAHPRAGTPLVWHEALRGLCAGRRYRCASAGDMPAFYANTSDLGVLRGRTLLLGGDSTIAQQLWALVVWLGRQTEPEPAEGALPAEFPAPDWPGEPLWRRVLRDFAVFFQNCTPGSIWGKPPLCPVRCWPAALGFALCWAQMQSRVVDPSVQLLRSAENWTAPVTRRRGLAVFTFGVWYCWNCGMARLLAQLTAAFVHAVDRILDPRMGRPAYAWREVQPQGFRGSGLYVERNVTRNATAAQLAARAEFTPEDYRARMASCYDPTTHFSKTDRLAVKSGARPDPRWYVAKTQPAVEARGLIRMRTWDIKPLRFYGRSADGTDDCTHVHIDISHVLNQRLVALMRRITWDHPPPLRNVSLDALLAVPPGNAYEAPPKKRVSGAKGKGSGMRRRR
eukprot:TRINITY_DN26417_c0_g1_i2.p1 TRINITY_DN26417_c0_g1~~TRINITY_DN26417_c0_g1_i2.p1  ORF type:complete len:460 (+),score=129.12 TRINITY_DN26417_c0_g1_i2:102-1481(+)